MDFKKFSIQVIFRVLIILALALLISYFYFNQDRLQLIFTFIVIITLLIIAVVEMIWFVSKTNRELSKFILSIKYSDFSVYFPEEKYPFYRIGFPSNFSGSVAPKGCSTMYIEVSYCSSNSIDNWYINWFSQARPLNSRFDCSKIEHLLGEKIKPWQEPLEKFVKEL